jgi:uncharacterized protein (TIGR00730 family)
VYAGTARRLGALLASAGVRLVYGGGSVGLMGIVADAALAGGGEVVGVIPRGLFTREIAHPRLTQLHETQSMHERKQLMFELSGAFVALPGGLGTLEELAEITTWGQLGLHRKPIVLVDTAGFWQPLLALLDRAVNDGFLRTENRNLISRVDVVDDILPAIETYRPPRVEKWIDTDET